MKRIDFEKLSLFFFYVYTCAFICWKYSLRGNSKVKLRLELEGVGFVWGYRERTGPSGAIDTPS